MITGIESYLLDIVAKEKAVKTNECGFVPFLKLLKVIIHYPKSKNIAYSAITVYSLANCHCRI